MYEPSFGLNLPPFRLLPDPHFYLEEGQYGTILAQLLDGLEAGEPCLLLTGPAGSGKTAAVQRLLMLLDRSRWTVGTMFASASVEGAGVLHAAAHAFDLAHGDTGAGPALDARLSIEAARGGRMLLVVDEAQHLDDGALRQIAERLAPNRETPRLQLCLVGEPSPAALARAEQDGSLRPVVVHCRLRALDATETREYVLHRLRCAGWTGRPAFDRATTDAIHRRSQGIPRRIHLIADRVLLQLSLDGADVATAAAVEATDDQWAVELQGRAPIEANVPVSAPVETRGSQVQAIEALLASIVVPAHASPGTGTHADWDAEAPPRIDSPAPPIQFAPDDSDASSTAAAPPGGPPPSPEATVSSATQSAGMASAEADAAAPGLVGAPRWSTANMRMAAAGAVSAPVETPGSQVQAIEALLASIVVPSHARPGTGTHPNWDAEAPPRIEPLVPPVQFAPDDSDASSTAAAPPGGPPPSPEATVSSATQSAGMASAEADAAPPGLVGVPRWSTANMRMAAAGAVVVALASMGIGWWLNDGGRVKPPAAASGTELERERPALIAPDRHVTGTVADPSGTLAATQGTATPAVGTAPTTAPPTTTLPTTTVATAPSAPGGRAGVSPREALKPPLVAPATGRDTMHPAAPAPAAPAPDLVTAAPAPLGGSPPSRPASGAAPSRVAVNAGIGSRETLDSLPMRSGPGRATSASPARGAASMSSLPRDALLRATGSAPIEATPAGEPPATRPTARAAAASSASATCTAAAAVLGLCELPAGVAQAPKRAPVTSPTASTAPAAGDAVTPEPQPAAPRAVLPETLPCEPKRATLGLCDR